MSMKTLLCIWVPAFVASSFVSGAVAKQLCKRYAGTLFSTELVHFDGAAARKEAVDRAHPFRQRFWWWGPLPLIQGVAAACLWHFLPFPRSVPDAYGMAVIVGVVSVATAVGEVWIAKRAITWALRERLIAEGTVVCRGCGYDLRGQVEPRCPECAKPFERAAKSESAGEQREVILGESPAPDA